MTIEEAVTDTSATRLGAIKFELWHERREYFNRQKEALGHAFVIGELLLEARDLVPRGGWLQWVENESPFALTTSQEFMRLARHRGEIEAGACVGVREALDFISGRGRRDAPDARREVARALRDEGLSHRQIAERLGVSQTTVHVDLLPRKKRQAESRAKWRRRALERKALRREENRKLAARGGGDVAEAYALLRQALEALDKSLAGKAREERVFLLQAISYLHAGEDEIGKALRVRPE